MLINGLSYPDLSWTDEFAWEPIVQTYDRTLTGAAVISEGVKIHGRPITLSSLSRTAFTRAQVKTLKTLAETAGASFPIVLADGQGFTVGWRLTEPPVIEATPAVPYANPDDTDWVFVNLKFQTLA